MAFREPGTPRERRFSARYLVLIPITLICAVTVIDSLFPPEVHLGPLLVAAPTFTAAFAGPLLTGAIAALAVVAQVVIGFISGEPASRNHQVQIAALIIVGTLVVLFTVVRDRTERRLATTRSVAAVAQRVLLRPPPARSGPLEIASLYLAAEEEAEMGGDLYAAARTDDSTRLLIGDVRGKGLPAYGHAALLLGAFRAAAHRKASLPALATHLDGAIRWDAAQWGSDAPDEEEVFATATLLDIPDRAAQVHTITCGHPSPLLLRDGEVRTLGARHGALPIGLGGLGDPGGPGPFRVDTFPFAPGDLLLLFTDGVTEARNAEGVFYPLTDRAAAWGGHGPREVLRLLHADLLTYTSGRLGDDAAVLAIRRGGAP